MITTEILLRYKIEFTKTIYDYGHCLIQIKNDGKGFTIEELSSADARKIIRERNLEKVKKEEYDYKLGDIYTDGKFKKYMNYRHDLKNIIIQITSDLDENNF